MGIRLWYDEDQRRRKGELFARQEAIDTQRQREAARATFTIAASASFWENLFIWPSRARK
jgi:hypothetical protein